VWTAAAAVITAAVVVECVVVVEYAAIDLVSSSM
jgi:hypothetical protein